MSERKESVNERKEGRKGPTKKSGTIKCIRLQEKALIYHLKIFFLRSFFHSAFMSHVTKSKAGKVEAKRFSADISAFVQVFTGLSSSCTPFG